MLPQRARYLVSFQYSGTLFSGVMETPPGQATLGVQNYLERAAEKLRPLVPIKFVISSRTDAGVHALCNTAHVDVERSGGKPPFSESVLVQALNRNLKPEPIRQETPEMAGFSRHLSFHDGFQPLPWILCSQSKSQHTYAQETKGGESVLGARRVSDAFHARFSAASRTYVYRVVTGCSHPSELPVFEQNLCWVTQRGHLDLAAMQDAAGFLVGTHDFSTFRSASSELPARNPVKTMDQVEIRPSSGFLMHHLESSELKFWELEFTSRSFLYKQVRRMAGVLVAVGQRRLDPECVKRLLEMRDLMAYPPVTVAPARGLFLKNVEYCKADLEIGRTEAET